MGRPRRDPRPADIESLARALARGQRGELDELMACTAAYTGPRQGELFALTAGQVDVPGRVITVDRKVVEVAGRLYLEPPKNRKTIYPARTPAGYSSPASSPAAPPRPAPSRPPASTPAP